MLTIEIVNQYGVVLKKYISQEYIIYIDFRQYVAGFYLIKVSTNNDVNTFKILKQ